MDQSELMSQLRRRIDEKHADAVRALEVLRDYLTEGGVLPAAPAAQQHTTAASAVAIQAVPAQDRVSYRTQVLTAITDGPRSVDEIVAATGLDAKRVRGVLNAPDLQARIQKSTHPDGSMTYELTSA